MTQMPFTMLEIPFGEIDGTRTIMTEKEENFATKGEKTCECAKKSVSLQPIEIQKELRLQNVVTKTSNLAMKLAQLQPDDYINKVFEADCLDVMRRLPSQSVDMILCDLPYGTTQNQWDSVIPLDLLWNQYKRIIKEDGAIILTSQGVFTAMLIMSQPSLFKYKLVWEKSKATNFLNAKKQPLRKYEDVCVFYKKQPTYNPQMVDGEPYDKGIRKNQLSGSYGDFAPRHVCSDGKRYPTDVIYFKTAESEGEVFHPTQKPVELGRYLVRTYSKPGDVILDNTCGSGSFLVAALLEGRNFVGIEKNLDVARFKDKPIDYIDVCKERLRDAWRAMDLAKRTNIKQQNFISTFIQNEYIQAQ